MRQSAVMGVATWMIERLTPRHQGESLAGDLLEELDRGRSLSWYCRQVVAALGQSAVRGARPYTMPLLFSASWSFLFTRCCAGGWSRLLRPELGRWSGLDWPLSSLLLISGGLLPAVSCLCLGCVFYVALLSRGPRRVSALRLAGSLSLGVNVLLVTTMAWSSLQGTATLAGPHLTLEAMMFLGANRPALSVPVALSLWSGLVCALRAPAARAGRYTSAA